MWLKLSALVGLGVSLIFGHPATTTESFFIGILIGNKGKLICYRKLERVTHPLRHTTTTTNIQRKSAPDPSPGMVALIKAPVYRGSALVPLELTFGKHVIK